MSAAGSVDQLIERGLERYGAGDVDGALMAWEEALGLDPQDLRAAAYVDYVRENYEMLLAQPKLPDVDVPFGLGEVGDDEYEVEVSAAKIEKYLESVDEGWFLDDEPPSGAMTLPASAPAPARTSTLTGAAAVPKPQPPAVAVSFTTPKEEEPLELDLGPAGTRSARSLPLPAEGSSPEITLEMEADEPDPRAAAMGLDDESTKDFVAGAWPPPPEVDLEFTDPRSAMPTRETKPPTGFVRARPEGLAPVISASVVPQVARGPKPTTPPPATDDDLATRPGNIHGGGTADPLDPIGIELAPEALSDFGRLQTGLGKLGPEDRTREVPLPTVKLPPVEHPGELELEPSDDERTIERTSMRADTASETTMERAAVVVRYTPAPLDDANEGREASGVHPPLVIIEDPVLGPPGTPHPRDVATDELAPGTARLKRPSTMTAIPSIAQPPEPTPASGGNTPEAIAAKLEQVVEAAALPDESNTDRTRRRVTDLLERAAASSSAGDHATAIVALGIALTEDPESAVAQKLLHRHQASILHIYEAYVGELSARPALAMPMHELAGQKLDIRAAFLLSRIDGTLSFEEILDVSGMQRPEAFRHLSNLLLRGILEVR